MKPNLPPLIQNIFAAQLREFGEGTERVLFGNKETEENDAGLYQPKPNINVPSLP
jgi:hypothetical protein